MSFGFRPQISTSQARRRAVYEAEPSGPIWARRSPAYFPRQVRAVFFAELGEKWDAMESVYEYMREDSRFDPIIVRTPVGRVVERDGKREQPIFVM